MPDWSAIAARPPFPAITPFSNESLGPYAGYTFSQIAYASAAWPTANLALYIPFRLTEPITVTKLFCINGATASGNIDLGIYSVDGLRLVSSGSTAQSGTNALQVVTVTSTRIGPGSFYMALAASSTSSTVYRFTSFFTGGQRDMMILLGCSQQASALPLPSTATFATVTVDYLPVFGLTSRSVI